MPNLSAPKKQNQNSIIYLTFFVLLSIPLVIFGLGQESFDIRNRAFEDLTLNEDHQCIISLPNVNPYSLEVGKAVTIQVDAKLNNDTISKLEIFNSTGEVIYQESYDNFPIEIGTNFTFTPEVSGTVDLLGIIYKGMGGSLGCEISSPYDVKGLRAIPNNSAPEFTSSPSASKPSQAIKTGIQYEYTLTASDIDGDRINYTYSFTPKADWLKPVIVEDGSGGKLTIKFRGTTDKPASYLANIFIHDGYSTSLRSQSWVISVSPSENDIPIIKIINPIDSLRVNKGTSFKTDWEATDLNHISKYELYITTNPTNENDWKVIDSNIPYNTNSYNIDTSDMLSGTYKVIAKAIDNQNPPKFGIGISPEIIISQTTDTKPEKEDVVILDEPQVINMSPNSDDEITNRRVTIKATIIGSKEGKIEDDSIKFILDDKDISDDIKINKISPTEYTLIYQPQEDLKDGVHKAEINFLDTKGLEASKSWTFTISAEDSSSDNTYNIFGYEISKNIVLIVGIGIAIVILALVTPFIIFTVWKDDKSKRDSDAQSNDRLPISTPSDNSSYFTQENTSLIKEKVENTPQVSTKESEVDVWDSYTAPKPVSQEQQVEDLKDLVTEEPQAPEPVITIDESVVENSPVPEPQAPILEEPPIQEPSIPEPEIPDADSLQKIFEQIQQNKDDN